MVMLPYEFAQVLQKNIQIYPYVGIIQIRLWVSRT